MRLLHVSTRELHEFPSDPPPYAILSHTWGMEEVTFEDLGKPSHTSKLGYKKLDGCCKQAQLSDFEWVWIDTCCIDKSSSAELTETINSMFAWYERSSMCYIYLEDVPPAHSNDHKKQSSAFRSSRWFTRGWTLQELLASKRRQIFDSTWQRIEFGAEVLLLSEITGIPKRCLVDRFRVPPSSFSVSERMSWASRRSTTRVEDIAYCLLGIFEVNMPLLYGEGSRAFFRLQEEIIRRTSDETIFCWDFGHCQEDSNGNPTSVLALSPAQFSKGGELKNQETLPVRDNSQRYEAANRLAHHTTLTNQGILIELPLHFIDEMNGLALAILGVSARGTSGTVVLPLVRANRGYSNIFTKAPGCTVSVLPDIHSPPPSSKRIYLQHWGNKTWEISCHHWSDTSLVCNFQLRGDVWRVDGWRCNGWYPPIPLTVDATNHSYSSDTLSFPPRILFIFGNQTCSLLCDLFWPPESYEVKISLSTTRTPALTPLEVLYSADSQRVELSKLERFEWTTPDVESTLSCGGRIVHGVGKHRFDDERYIRFDGVVDVELSMS